ncbi:MAG: MoxR family ATPase [Clostridia bacterium]|nr:MoxR family ATPase [Clostridia bacterium]
MGTEGIHEKLALVRDEIKKVIIGKDDVIEAILMTVLSGGHVLLEDIPGVGKTTLALAFSKTLSLRYNRMQFTPDVLPADVTGFSMYNKHTETFEYKEGAVICNLFLADEINRTSPKTQSALLEVMEEGKVTVDGVTHPLPRPFFVIATQNPLGSAGTQRLPESQLDRFMVRLTMGYPDLQSEVLILKGENINQMENIKSVVTLQEIIDMQNTINDLHVDDSIYDYIAELMLKSRTTDLLKSGISPRGGKALLRMARAHAFLHVRDYVVPEDVLAVMPMVTSHRVTLSAKAKAAGMTEEEIIKDVMGQVEMPSIK